MSLKNFFYNENERLIKAVCNGDIQGVINLLGKGANVNYISKEKNYTPLMFALDQDQPEVAKILIENNAAVNINDTTGITPLMQACVMEFPDIVKILLEKGAYKDTKEIQGRSALNLVKELSDYVGLTNTSINQMLELLEPDPVHSVTSSKEKKKENKETNNKFSNELVNGDYILCGICGEKLLVKYFPKVNIFIGGQELMDSLKGIALSCQKCNFYTCIDCAMKPLDGTAQCCPSCHKVLGPTVFTEGIPQYALNDKKILKKLSKSKKSLNRPTAKKVKISSSIKESGKSHQSNNYCSICGSLKQQEVSGKIAEFLQIDYWPCIQCDLLANIVIVSDGGIAAEKYPFLFTVQKKNNLYDVRLGIGSISNPSKRCIGHDFSLHEGNNILKLCRESFDPTIEEHLQELINKVIS